MNTDSTTLTQKEIEKRVIDGINTEIGSDFKKLRRAAVLREQYKERLQKLRNKLNYDNSENVSSFKSAMQMQLLTSEAIEFEMEKFKQFGKKLKLKIKDIKIALQGTEPDLIQLRKLQQLLRYLRIIQDVQELNSSLKNAINGRDEDKLVNLYLTLYEHNDRECSVIGRLQAVEAAFLKSYAERTAIYWHKQLKTKFSAEFETTLKAMRWGQKEHDSLTQQVTREHISKAQLLAEYLFLIKSPLEEDEPLESVTRSIVCQPVSTVTKYLLAPYRQRFLFHFTGTRKTNRLDKPEWFFTQIINWGKEVHMFVGQTFQPAAVKAGKLDFNIRLEFVRGLVQFTIEKISADIDQISQDEHLFAHLLDETLAFEAEIREVFGYPPSFPSAICVITQPTYLLKWISLEERFCEEKMDSILQSENPWQLIDPNIFDDELKIPRCADQFMRMLDAIKDRYYLLLQPGHQLQFLTLQLELIDNFRRRLVQLHSSNLVSSIPILNAINYVTMVLREWGENVHYLHLHGAIVGVNASTYKSVFEHPVSELEHWSQSLLRNIASKAVQEVKAKSMSYRHDSWSTMPEQNSREPFILSPSGGEMFQEMVTTLHKLEGALSLNLFNYTLREIAKQIDDYFFDAMIVNTKFSPAGAAQFNYDMTRNLFALFGQYVNRPDLLFKKIHGSNKLLNAARGTALLLLETLQSIALDEEKVKVLKEVGVVNLKPKHCVEVLERRTDIKIY